jgi:predicted RNase H-like nuclease
MRLEGKAVLGIDAAWTDGEPSGVALLQRKGSRWQCVRAAPSYSAFCGSFEWTEPFSGAPIDVHELLRACRQLLGAAQPAAVAVDMPLATTRIEGRRRADDEVSRRFGHCKCAVHSPSRVRPGETGRRLERGFAQAGYSLATTECNGLPALLEVYPHVALLGLSGRSERLPYKAGKTTTYWRGQLAESRKRRLGEEWAAIIACLQQQIDGIDLPLPDRLEAHSFAFLKRFEDCLDGIVCAWMATKFLEESAIALGDETAAIWVPSAAMKQARVLDAA